MPTPENEDIPTVAIRPSSVNPSALFEGLPEPPDPTRDALLEVEYIERAWARFEAVSARLAATKENTPERHAAEARMLLLADEFLERFPPEEDPGVAGFWNEEGEEEKKPDTLRSVT